MQVVALFSLVLASVSASALIARDGQTTKCEKFDAVRPNKATCNDPATLFCPGGCTGGVTAKNCKTLQDYKPISGDVLCDGGFTSASGTGIACQGSKVGSVVCYGNYTGYATCSGCRTLTDDDKKHLHDNQSPSEPVPNTSSPTEQPAQNTSSSSPDENNPTGESTNPPATSTSNSTECANKTQPGTPTGPVTTGTAVPGSTSDNPNGAEALMSSGPIASGLIALITAAFSVLL